MNCVRDSEGLSRIEFGPENEIVLASMTYADCSVEISKTPFDQFVEMNTSKVVVAEK